MFGVRSHRQLTDFGDVFQPSEAQEPILPKDVRSALHEWLIELFSQEELHAVGIKPRKKAMFFGPPGVGKTTLAHHLSARLGLTMLAVRPENIIDCFLGSTGQNIGALFDIAKQQNPPIVLFIDEFDAVAPKRTGEQSRGGATQERDAYVNTLLQRVEQHDGFIIAATNFGDRIDQAIWRRFDIHITLELPGQFERQEIIKRYLAPYGLPQDALEALAEALETAAPSLIRQFCEGLKRQTVLGPRVGWNMQREAVIERLLTAVQPHPELGKPRLWSHKHQDKSVRALPWPLPLAADLPKEKKAKKATRADNVVQLGARP